MAKKPDLRWARSTSNSPAAVNLLRRHLGLPPLLNRGDEDGSVVHSQTEEFIPIGNGWWRRGNIMSRLEGQNITVVNLDDFQMKPEPDV